MEYKVKIESFEGPLDLLLHLINRLEIDIYDIPMAEITEQYLLFVHAMKELELDGASEYLVMAATLLAIKSKMLLPTYDEQHEDELFFEEEDPRDELVERLIEYKKYKEAALELKQKERDRGEIFMKPPSDLSPFAEPKKEEMLDIGVTIYDMLGAYHKLMRRKKLKRPLVTKITQRELSIEDRMDELLLDLKKGERKSFFSFFQSEHKSFIVVTFLAMLELMKRKEIIVEQHGNFDEIYLSGVKEAQ
ncbi:segregation/condensation protein A [Bacillus sp. FJAT-50079]|uniref:segregation/condensation protein A n=1 Tax=Bacillus sp. FJAT-50079 TaxID=2833577 RepID=UPI001BC8F6C3|nr:segregation/condensation protein A [Bacillus sp. FJAT-50079]MBS4209706.1 segregation/condensation protein A [Bacillus sp. FJAT-50079]